MSNEWNPNHGDNKFKKKSHFGFNKEVNSITFRVLPQPKGFPYGSMEYNNTPFDSTWHKFHAVIFGYKNTEGKHRSFESPLVKNNKTKMIEVPCAATERVNELKAKLEEARVTGNAAIQPRLNALVGLKGVYNIDNNHHMNVVLLDGTIGELKLRHKAFLALKVEIDKLRVGSPDDVGFDPLSFQNGRFFTVTRSTAGRETTFNVSVYKEKVEVAGMGRLEKPLVHILTPEVLARLETDGFRLDDVCMKVTSDECAQIVAESDLMSGKSPACDRFFDQRWKARREAGKTQTDGTQSTDGGSPTPTLGVINTNAQINTAEGTPQVAQTLAVTPTVTVVHTPTPQTTAQQPALAAVVDDMSDEEFFKQIGAPGSV